VICFQCGKGLRDWGINDRPWEEHATWFPDCPLVLAVHGKDYATAMKQRQVCFMKYVPLFSAQFCAICIKINLLPTICVM
jgi:hypothetical protein